MKWITLFLFLASSFTQVIGCSEEEVAGGEGLLSADFDGAFNNYGVVCVDTNNTIIAISKINGTFTDTITINDGVFTQVRTSTGCAVVSSGNITGTDTQLSLKSATVSSATGGGCTVAQTVAAGSISPTSINTAYTAAQALTNRTGLTYLWFATGSNLETILIENSAYTATGSAMCFDEYVKQ